MMTLIIARVLCSTKFESHRKQLPRAVGNASPSERSAHRPLTQSQHECQQLSALWGTIQPEIFFCPLQGSEHLCEKTCIELLTARLGVIVAEAETNPEGKKKEMKCILVPVETSRLLWGSESGLCSLTWKRCPWDTVKWIRRGRGEKLLKTLCDMTLSQISKKKPAATYIHICSHKQRKVIGIC